MPLTDIKIDYTPRFEPPPHRAWPEMDPSLFEDGKPALPAFPLEVLPPPWQAWVNTHFPPPGATTNAG